jgi:hypothetical protein
MTRNLEAWNELESRSEEAGVTETTCTRPLAGTPPTTMLPLLEQIHAAWLEELTELVRPTQQVDPGVWTRWNVIRYLETTFAQRLAREREALADIPRHLTASETTTLWALGELLDLESQHLHHLVGLCQHRTEFTIFAGKLLETLEHWCHANEEELGRVPWSQVPEQSRELLLQLADDLSEGPPPDAAAAAARDGVLAKAAARGTARPASATETLVDVNSAARLRLDSTRWA